MDNVVRHLPFPGTYAPNETSANLHPRGLSPTPQVIDQLRDSYFLPHLRDFSPSPGGSVLHSQESNSFLQGVIDAYPLFTPLGDHPHLLGT